MPWRMIIAAMFLQLASTHVEKMSQSFTWLDDNEKLDVSFMQYAIQVRSTERTKQILYLHIGKTGGSSIYNALTPALDPQKMQYLNHEQAREEMHQCHDHIPNATYVYFVRDPVERFVSSWVESFRFGKPDHLRLWYPSEILAFFRFHSPDELATALSSEDPQRLASARWAMQSIEHVKWGFADYWGGLANFRQCHNATLFVGRVEHFEEDFARLVTVLEANHALLNPISKLPPDVRISPAKYDGFKRLSDRAVKNLRAWYAEDYVMIRNLTGFNMLPSDYVLEVSQPYISSSVPTPSRITTCAGWFIVLLLSVSCLCLLCCIQIIATCAGIKVPCMCFLAMLFTFIAFLSLCAWLLIE